MPKETQPVSCALDETDEAILQVLGCNMPHGVIPLQIQKDVPVYTFKQVPISTIVEKLDRFRNIGYAKVKHGDNTWTLTSKGQVEALVSLPA